MANGVTFQLPTHPFFVLQHDTAMSCAWPESMGLQPRHVQAALNLMGSLRCVMHLLSCPEWKVKYYRVCLFLHPDHPQVHSPGSTTNSSDQGKRY